MFGKDKKKYDVSTVKSPKSFYISRTQEAHHLFEISNCLKNGKVIFDNVQNVTINSTTPPYHSPSGDFTIQLVDKKQNYVHKFFDFDFDVDVVDDDGNFSFSLIEIFNFESDTGKLFIDDDKNDHYEIQLKFKTQTMVLNQFLNFVHLRNIKINDQTLHPILIENNPEKIMLKKNNMKLHEYEQIVSIYSSKNSVKWNDDDYAVNILKKFVITNFRIMNDVWCNPILFDKRFNSETVDVEKIISDSIFNFTHDEYDDVIATNVKNRSSSMSISRGGTNEFIINNVGTNEELHSIQGISEGVDSGDIVFMLKGKRLWTWTNFQDPKGIVKMIKSSKKQFESQNESPSEKELLQVLKMRLIKGEITKEEFTELKEML
jgi:hypothetical protein|tara:strand:- start:1939 stop:3063 length:1125 start_codon:yes stop_codon:yes gene_type:complete